MDKFRIELDESQKEQKFLVDKREQKIQIHEEGRIARERSHADGQGVAVQIPDHFGDGILIGNLEMIPLLDAQEECARQQESEPYKRPFPVHCFGHVRLYLIP
jgi:hypothetical protein